MAFCAFETAAMSGCINSSCASMQEAAAVALLCCERPQHTHVDIIRSSWITSPSRLQRLAVPVAVSLRCTHARHMLLFAVQCLLVLHCIQCPEGVQLAFA